jgi:gas vesicle protein
MMEEETLRLIIRHLNELKTDISTVTAGQEELKNDMKSEISAVKNDIENSISDNISALETKINAGHVELRREISDFQERIRGGLAEFEERVTRNLREDLSRNIEAGQAEFEERVTRNLREDFSRNIEATRHDFETQLAALQVQTRRAGAGNAGTNADKVKPPKFDGSTSWVVFQRQFDAAAICNDWTPREKAAHLLSVLQGQAAYVLHSVPAEASY